VTIPSVEDVADVALKGFLFKQRDVFKTWRKRYVHRLQERGGGGGTV
jgi:hypothetical protein